MKIIANFFRRNIESASKRTAERGEGVDVAVGGPGKVFGLVLVPQQCPHSKLIIRNNIELN